jgi:hypothetical protein
VKHEKFSSNMTRLQRQQRLKNDDKKRR